jgi:GGDEF domain-containing protein
MNYATQAALRVLLLHGDLDEAKVLAKILTQAGFAVIMSTLREASQACFWDAPPSLMLVADGTGGRPIETLSRHLRADPFLGRLPMVVLVGKRRADHVDWNELEVDDYVLVPYSAEDLVRRLRLAFHRMARSLDANPLTRLPGNTSIQQETLRRIDSGKPFALAYLDIDHFKAFNDRYGYLRGDEVLLVTARLLTTVVQEQAGGDAFVGHVGGDDFVCLSAPDLMDRICQILIQRFDLVIPDFYDPEDRGRGYIESIDRRGNREQFPLMTLSIAVVSNDRTLITHPGQISSIISQLKKRAKALPGSKYVKDQRTEERCSCGEGAETPTARAQSG